MKYVFFSNDIATDIYFGISLPEEAVEIPSHCAIVPGQHRSEYDNNWILRPLVDRIAEGFVIIPEGMKLSEDKKSFVPKTDFEKMADGLIDIPRGQKLNSDKTALVSKSLSEQVADGEITEGEATEAAKNIIRIRRQAAFVDIDKQATIAMYDKRHPSDEWIEYREEWLQSPNKITDLKSYEQWTPPIKPS